MSYKETGEKDAAGRPGVEMRGRDACAASFGVALHLEEAIGLLPTTTGLVLTQQGRRVMLEALQVYRERAAVLLRNPDGEELRLENIRLRSELLQRTEEKDDLKEAAGKKSRRATPETQRDAPMTRIYHWRQSVAVEEARIAYDIARDAQIHAERSGTHKDSDTMWQLTRASDDAFDALCNTVVSVYTPETPR